MRRLLVMDVGNTNVTVGFYVVDQLRHTWRFRTDSRMTEDELAVMLRPFVRSMGCDLQDVQRVVMSCVVPKWRRALRRFGEKYLSQPPLFVDSSLHTGLTFACEQPASVGADLIANAVAFHTLYGSPTVIMDLGTATTFTVLESGGRFLGGLIAPGVQSITEVLSQRIPHLPLVDIEKPETIVGRTTEQAIQSGGYYGILGSLEGTLQHLQEEYGGTARLPVVATGGLAEVWVRSSEQVDVVDPQLTLHGLRILYEKNSS